MTVKEGDLIRFLNATGGGTVTRIDRQTSTVFVKDETGFEIPVKENEVVVVTEGSTIVPKVTVPGKPASAFKPEETGNAQPLLSTKEKDPRKRDLSPRSKVSAYLCFLPEEGKKPGEGDFEAFLVNDSQYDLFVAYASGEDNAKRTVRFQGVIPFDSIEQIDLITQGKELDKRARSSFVLIPFVRDDSYPKKDPFVVELKVEGGKFYKAGAFVANEFFEDKAIVYPLVEEDKPYQPKRVDPEALAEQMMSNKTLNQAKEEKRARTGDLRRNDPAPKKEGPIVVDLHASELLETTAGMGNKEILDYQLSKVREVMRAHRKPADKGRKIVFIHGKGEGVLREALTALIKKEYPRCSLQDASFQEYGFGATQVTIR